jgi:hypothetical protein
MRHKMIDGVLVQFTDAEESERDAREAEYLASENDRVAFRLRAERNQLLTASDWTQVIDAPVDQAAWAAYRQALRDLPQQAGFPTTITWPVKP